MEPVPEHPPGMFEPLPRGTRPSAQAVRLAWMMCLPFLIPIGLVALLLVDTVMGANAVRTVAWLLTACVLLQAGGGVRAHRVASSTRIPNDRRLAWFGVLVACIFLTMTGVAFGLAATMRA